MSFLFENQDIATLGVVNVRYCGYTAVVKVEEREDDKKQSPLPYIELLDQPDGGACALNVNRFFFTLAYITFVPLTMLMLTVSLFLVV